MKRSFPTSLMLAALCCVAQPGLAQAAKGPRAIPVLISGTGDIFQSNSARVRRKLHDAGVPTELEVYEGQSHAIYLDADIPESAQAFGDMAPFLERHLKKR
ncbi:hypothetical protein GCM10009087_13040 [Sphingomonas oligophenolica]|uniref:Alpha/beta hydrolase n=1 Tax=Sphingomonas oligophenolica TaxID=301154 RepID=A0ABU9YBR6_9SPHN